MYGKVIILLIVVLILILAVYLFATSGSMSDLKKAGGRVKEVLNSRKDLEVIGGPVIYYRCKGDRRYHEVTVKEEIFTIGRGKNNSLVLSSRNVETKHAVIRKRVKDNHVYFELINYAKVNPVEYYNQRKNIYENLRYKDAVELDIKEAFYIGDVKFITTLPDLSHRPTETEMMKVKSAKTSSAENDRTVSQRMPGKNEFEF